MTNFTRTTMVANGKEYRAMYRINPDASVTIWAGLPSGQNMKVECGKDHPLYEAAYEAAKTAAAENLAKRAATIASLEFIGTTLKGKGWKIEFSADYDRTMLTFSRKPSQEIRDMLKEAHWNWSPSRNAWVKKLSRKCFLEAQDTHNKLWAMVEGRAA